MPPGNTQVACLKQNDKRTVIIYTPNQFNVEKNRIEYQFIDRKKEIQTTGGMIVDHQKRA